MSALGKCHGILEYHDQHLGLILYYMSGQADLIPKFFKETAIPEQVYAEVPEGDGDDAAKTILPLTETGKEKMMEYEVPKSKCEICGSLFARQGMTRHLKSCLKKDLEKKGSGGKPKDLLLLNVSDAPNPDYFLYLLLDEETTLEALDIFLRNIWLECCGHMSSFSVGRYGDEIDMMQKVSGAFEFGDNLTYRYDFGSTTELNIRGMGSYKGLVKEKIQIIARNAPPIIPCDQCSAKPAVQVCTECIWDGGWLCEDCAKTHDCDEDMFLPVVNSPRTGVCAYMGNE